MVSGLSTASRTWQRPKPSPASSRDTSKFPRPFSGVAQTRQVLENLKRVMAAAGVGFEDVVKCVVFLTDMGNFAAVNEVYAEYMAEPFPARSCVQVAGLPLGAQVEIEAIAVAKG